MISMQIIIQDAIVVRELTVTGLNPFTGFIFRYVVSNGVTKLLRDRKYLLGRLNLLAWPRLFLTYGQNPIFWQEGRTVLIF